MAAASVAYLAILPIEQRMRARNELAEYLLQRCNLECSEGWSNIQSEQVHCKFFKVLSRALKIYI
jgi:hypothetical protein